MGNRGRAWASNVFVCLFVGHSRPKARSLSPVSPLTPGTGPARGVEAAGTRPTVLTCYRRSRQAATSEGGFDRFRRGLRRILSPRAPSNCPRRCAFERSSARPSNNQTPHKHRQNPRPTQVPKGRAGGTSGNGHLVNGAPVVDVWARRAAQRRGTGPLMMMRRMAMAQLMRTRIGPAQEGAPAVLR